MTVFVLCINPETATYAAFCAEDPLVHSFGYGDAEAAVGRLLMQHPGLNVQNVVALEQLWKLKS